MPYSTNSDLPDNVKNNLPSHAQDIYREAFNHAYQEYSDPSKRYSGRSLEETAHAVAWKAVEKIYTKDNSGNWVKK